MTLLLFLIFTSFSYLGYVLLCCIFSVWLITLSILSSKSIHVAANADEQLSGWTTNTLQSTTQSQSCTKKRSRSLFGGPLPVWSTTAFWTPVKPLYLRHMLKKLIRYTQNCNACSCYWSTERAQFFSMTTHGCRYTTNTSKVETTGLQSFASSTIFTWPPANYHFFKHLNTFLQEKSFPNL